MSTLRVTPIYGSRWSPQGQAEEPSCTLVEYGGCRVLWNVGWWASAEDANESFPELPEHDCLIITDSKLQAAGGLPLYYRQMQQKQRYAPIYATFPTVKMGQMTLYDQHAAISLDGGQPPYTLEDLDNVFASIESIKYSQSMTVYEADSGQASLSITAHRAGHVVGGAFYVLQRLQDETQVVLTSTYHIAKELHLDSSSLLKYASTPDVLLTHPGGPAFNKFRKLAHGPQPALPSRLVTQNERDLVENILSVLRRDGNVLLPTDASGRVLELVLLLNQHWEKHRLQGAYNLCWLGPMVTNTAEFARSQLEWMAAQLGNQFDSMSGHPYALKAVQFCTSMQQLQSVMEENQNPTCVLASGLSLEGGPARDLLLQFFDNADNAIVFTDSSQAYLRRRDYDTQDDVALDTSVREQETTTLPAADTAAASEQEDAAEGGMVGSAVTQTSLWTTTGQLLSAWCQAKLQGREMEDSVTVDVKVPHRVPLAGAELRAFLADEEAARQKQKEMKEEQAMLREVELAKGQLRLGEDEAGTTEPTKVQQMTTAFTRPRKKSRFDSTLFLKFSKPLHLMFEMREEAVGIGQPDSTAKYGIGESVGRQGEVLEDDYGIAVQPERFVDIVSGVDPSKFAGGSGRIGDDVLRRGFGYGIESRSSTKGGVPNAARISEDEDQDESDEMDEQALEAVDLSEGKGIIRGRNGRAPTKVATVPRKLEVLAEISYVPLEGRVDAGAARQSVRALQPRQVIVLGGPAADVQNENLVDEVTLLAEAARSFATDKKEVLTPSDGITAELDVGHPAYAVRLVNTPYRTREEKETSLTVPEPIEPFETKLGVCTVSLVDCVATGQKVAVDGSTVLAPRQLSADDTPSVYLSEGEVQLPDLRAELIAEGMKAEFSTRSGYSQLVVNGKVVVKKEKDSGRIAVEGPLCEDFYTVRSIVCGQYVTL